ncbi:MAG: thiamine-phosphate kinase [Pirellulales bacterium]
MESQFIAWLRERLYGHRRLRLGPGDDAAVLRLADRSECVITTDLLTDGVDFVLSRTEARRVGHKALAVNLSDLAAMAARPVAAVVALALPGPGALELAKQLYEGMLPLAERFDLAIAGGDTNTWDGPLVIAVTAIGETTERGPLVRSGARVGDRIIVTGQFGGSILGRHLDVEPRLAEALLLHERYDLHAGIDCSDGLSLDLSRLCAESGCGAVIDLDRVPIAAAAVERVQGSGFGVQDSPGKAGVVRASALDHALSDGEDFELILAAPRDEAARMIAEQPLAGVPVTDIGEFVAERGLWQRDAAGRIDILEPRGWEH